MIQWMLVFSRYGKLDPHLIFTGKIRLKRWFKPQAQSEKNKTSTEAVTLILSRKPNMCNILEYKEMKLIYKRYASLYFCFCVDADENELIVLEMIHRYVQVLDEYFGNVCELDIIYGFQHAYILLDELLIGGQMQETSKKSIMSTIKKITQAETLELLDMAVAT